MKYKNPVPTADDLCIICQRPFAHTHEVFHGPNRQLSMKYKLQVRLCQEHHTGKNGVHFNPEFELRLKKEYQQKFEDQHGHEEWMRLFKRNYL